MKNKVKNVLIPIIASSISALFPFVSVFAADNCSNEVCNGNYPESVKAACGCNTPTANEDPLIGTITGILNGIIAALGIVSVIFIIVGGINFMTSTGDSGKVKKARDTILYACIGLIICALAAVIVNFTINLLNAPSTD